MVGVDARTGVAAMTDIQIAGITFVFGVEPTMRFDRLSVDVQDAVSVGVELAEPKPTA